ncbi:MAG: hypothetical protein C4B58_11335 [Deltaproteobacteria bacterium]|nr:MAG: hypothetical protein C4B58_11335 [Deltaproteobacteria bacterium]
MRILIILFSLIFFFTSLAHGQWWQCKELKETAKLTEKQIKEMDNIFDTYRQQRIDLSAKAQKSRLEVNNLLAGEKLDQEKFDEASDKLIDARQQMFKEMVNMKLKIRGHLTPKQIRMLLAEDPNMFSLQKRWMGGQKRAKARVIIKKGGEK